jgi:hypothetical protein
MRSQKHKRKAAVSRKVVERILPPTYKVSRLRESSSDRSVPQSRSEHLKRNGTLSAGAKARRRHEEFVARLSSPLGSSVNRGDGAPNGGALEEFDLRGRKVRRVPGSPHPWLPTH